MYGVGRDEVMFTNGSDEILNFAFMAYCDDKTSAIFPKTTYGFYPVFAELNHVPYKEIELNEDFSINIEDYFNAGGTILLPIQMLLQELRFLLRTSAGYLITTLIILW